MRKKKGANRAVTLAQVERRVQVKEAYLPLLEASTVPQELKQRYIDSITQEKARIVELQGGQHDKQTA